MSVSLHRVWPTYVFGSFSRLWPMPFCPSAWSLLYVSLSMCPSTLHRSNVCLSVRIPKVCWVLVYLESVCLTDCITLSVFQSMYSLLYVWLPFCLSVSPHIVWGISVWLSVCLESAVFYLFVFLLFSQHTLHPALTAIEVIFFMYSCICSGLRSNMNLQAHGRYTALLLIHWSHS